MSADKRLREAAKRFAALAGKPGAYEAYKELVKAAVEYANGI